MAFTPTISHLKANLSQSEQDKRKIVHYLYMSEAYVMASPYAHQHLTMCNCSMDRLFVRASVRLSSVCILTSSMHLSAKTS